MIAVQSNIVLFFKGWRACAANHIFEKHARATGMTARGTAQARPTLFLPTIKTVSRLRLLRDRRRFLLRLEAVFCRRTGHRSDLSGFQISVRGGARVFQCEIKS